VPFAGGLSLHVRLSESPGAQVFALGATEHCGLRVFEALLGPGATVLDVGSNMGEYSLVAARAVGPRGLVIAFEPWPSTFALLERSAAYNALANIVCVPVAVSDVVGTVPFQLPDCANTALASISVGTTQATGSTLAVPCTTVDSVVSERAVGSIDVIKIDVEGFEDRVLRGASDTLQRDRPLVFFEVNGLRRALDGGYSSDSIDILRTHGYEMYGVKVVTGRCLAVRLSLGEDPRGFQDRWHGPGSAPNLLAVHPSHASAQKVVSRLTAGMYLDC
jgi:FkbM family methyltransferase